MSAIHPLDQPVWSALTGRQADVAVVEGAARRFDPAHNVFAALGERSDRALEDLGRLITAHGDVAFLEADPPTEAPGVAVAAQDIGVQMVATRLQAPAEADVEIVPLTEADAPAMLALATLTEPGPFFPLTHRLGAFVGVRLQGRLVAMAGTRMRPAGFTEVSGVCTHPDHRGRGYAGALMHAVAGALLARGETPFLHAYAANTGAIALYERLGFEVRREVLMTRLTRA